jgi:type IV pilus assembly protein PilE
MRHNPGISGLQRGFTLIELMIVVGVIAVLAMIAYPTFTDSVRKSRRADAMAGLMRLQQLQERYRGNQPTYATVLAAIAPSSDSPERYYTLSIDAADGGSYRMSATAKSGSSQFGDTNCRRITVIMSNGSINTTSFDANNVEDTTNSNRCWVR